MNYDKYIDYQELLVLKKIAGCTLNKNEQDMFNYLNSSDKNLIISNILKKIEEHHLPIDKLETLLEECATKEQDKNTKMRINHNIWGLIIKIVKICNEKEENIDLSSKIIEAC